MKRKVLSTANTFSLKAILISVQSNQRDALFVQFIKS
jgi:hypothetical protein